MSELKVFFLRPPVKTCVIYLFTIGSSILCNMVFDSGAWWIWLIFVVFIVVYSVVLVAYAKSEKSVCQELSEVKSELQSQKVEIEDLQFTNEAFSQAMQGIATICKYSAKNANIQIHEIIDKKRVDCKAWNFDLASETVCQSIYSNVIKNLGISKASDVIVDIEVGYVKLIEDSLLPSGEQKISLCGYYHPTRNGPKILGKQRKIEEADGFHDAALFYKASDQPDILLDASAIMSVFKKCDGKDYSQYLGIPVFCATQNTTSKMIGLLQVVCHGDSRLADSEEQLKALANTFFVPYAYLFLLLFKTEKALRAQPKR